MISDDETAINGIFSRQCTFSSAYIVTEGMTEYLREGKMSFFGVQFQEF